jgi:hemolysin III
VSDAPPARPRLRGRIHQVAFFVALPAGIALVVLARGAAASTVAAIYAGSLVAVFGVSALYHRGSWTPAARLRMKRLDHSMIFVLIAGTYTPVVVLALHGPWQVVLLSIVWVGAVVGIAMKVAKPNGLGVTTATLYVVLGWAALVALPQLLRGLSPAGFALMVAGGLLYTAGAIVFALRRPDPRPLVFGYHEIWHAFMAAAATCHFLLIALVVTRG